MTIILNFVKRNLALLLLLVAAASYFAFAVHRLHGLEIDDSFIHRRIATNYAQTGHAFFNSGQRFMVTSSPLWTVLLTLCVSLFGNGNPVPWLEFFFLLAGAAAAFLLLQEGFPKRWGAAMLLPAIGFLFVFFGEFPIAIGQMETPCAVALLLVGCLGVVRGKGWGLPLLALACMARYECMLLLVLAVLWTSLRGRWNMPSLITTTGVGLISIAWLLSQYRTLIPNTIIAKSHAYVLTYKQASRSFIVSISSTAVCIVLCLLWWFYARNRQRGQNPSAFFLTGFSVLLLVAYILGKTFVAEWYLPLVLVPLAIGILCWTGRQSFLQQVLGVLFAGSVLLPFARTDASEFLATLHNSPGSTRGFEGLARVHEYRRIGAALYGVCPAATLMTSEIGGLGWGFRGTILDGVGLASPEAVHYHPIPVPGGLANKNYFGVISGIPAKYVSDARPDLIVSYDMFAVNALPTAISLNYKVFSFPLFVREDRPYASSLWTASRMLVMVAPDGRCSAAAVHDAVSEALER